MEKNTEISTSINAREIIDLANKIKDGQQTELDVHSLADLTNKYLASEIVFWK